MKRETYERALRSAAQISFLSLPLAIGCGNTYEPVDPTPMPGDGDGDGDGDDYRGDGTGDAYGDDDDGADGDGDGASKDDDGTGDGSDGTGDGEECADSGTPPVDCATALKDAYPNGDPNWFDNSSPTPRVDTGVPVATLVECCTELAAGPDASFTLRDTGCCSLNNETDGSVANVGLACTPWGPPMPRAMQKPEVLS